MGHFCLFISQQPGKSQFWKNEKKPGDILILHMCTINDNHMMYGSWDMECNRQNFLSFWTIFFALLPPNNLKNQNFDNMEKNPGDITILHQCTKNPNHRLHCSWDTMHGRCNFYFSFWAIFCAFTPLTT